MKPPCHAEPIRCAQGKLREASRAPLARPFAAAQGDRWDRGARPFAALRVTKGGQSDKTGHPVQWGAIAVRLPGHPRLIDSCFTHQSDG
jgi:hypothetical protein